MKRMLSLALLFGLVASFVGCGEEAKKDAPAAAAGAPAAEKADGGEKPKAE